MTLRKTNRATCTREHTHVVHVSLISSCARPMCTSLCGASFVMRSPDQFNGQFHLFWPGRRIECCGRRGPCRGWHPCAAHHHFLAAQVIFRRHKTLCRLDGEWESRRGRPFKLRRGHAILSAVVRILRPPPVVEIMR
jgi:hypothetical protein